MCFVNESNFTAATLLVLSELLKARKDIQVYHARYRDRITPFMLCKQIADLFQEYT